MNFMKKEIYILLFVLSLISCSSDVANKDNNFTFNNLVVDIKQPISNFADDNTRAVDIGAGASFLINFEHGDTIGIFSQGGAQIPFPLPIASGTTAASVPLLAEGWMTKLSEVYSLYLPYNFYNRQYDHIFWDGRRIIRQEANNSKLHLGKYLLMASDTVIQNNTDGVFHTSLKLLGTELRCRFTTSAAGQYIRMMLVSPNKSFSTHGYYDLFDKANGQPHHSLGESDHIILTISTPSSSAVGKQVIGFMLLPETDVTNLTMGCYAWDSNGNCYYGSTYVTTGIWRRGTANDISFTNMHLVTSPSISLNPWEKSENICPTCTPVAF